MVDVAGAMCDIITVRYQARPVVSNWADITRHLHFLQLLCGDVAPWISQERAWAHLLLAIEQHAAAA